MRKLVAIIFVALIVGLPSARTQDDSIKLSDDGTPTTVKGHVNPLSSKDYRLNVPANQRIAIHLISTSTKKLVKFNLRRNKYTGKPLPGADAVTDWEGTLKEGGDYWIGVFALPAAGEENFTLVISATSEKKSDDGAASTEPNLYRARIPGTSAIPQSFVPRGWKIDARAEGLLTVMAVHASDCALLTTRY